MHKHLIIDAELLAKEFEIDPSPPMLVIGSFPNYRKEKSIDMLFPYQILKDLSGKTFIIGLFLEDRIFHFVICKVLVHQVINFT